MRNLNKKRILTSLGIFIFIFIFSIIGLSEVQALEFKPQVGIPDTMFEGSVSMEGNNSGTSLIAEFVKAIYSYGISVGAILAAIMLMAGGLIWLTSAGSQEKVSKAKDIIIGSITGLALLFGSYVLLNTINPNLINLKTREITGIHKVAVGCCQISTSTIVLGGTTQIQTRAQLTSPENCKNLDGKYKGENYIPNTDIITGIGSQEFQPGTVCAADKLGCCVIVGSGFSGNWMDYVNKKPIIDNFFSFPSAQKNCPGNGASYVLAHFTVHFIDEKCDYKNVKDCSNLVNGTLCWDDLYPFTNCWNQMACGFCYYGSCLTTLGKEGQLCGGVGSSAKCKTSCHNTDETIDLTGRYCEGSLKCCKLKTQIQL